MRPRVLGLARDFLKSVTERKDKQVAALGAKVFSSLGKLQAHVSA
jgi:hypothetical protein